MKTGIILLLFISLTACAPGLTGFEAGINERYSEELSRAICDSAALLAASIFTGLILHAFIAK